MNRFLLFAYLDHEGHGGMEDFHSSFTTEALAKSKALELGQNFLDGDHWNGSRICNRFQILDIKSGKTVKAHLEESRDGKAIIDYWVAMPEEK